MTTLLAAMLLAAPVPSFTFSDCRIGPPGAGPRMAAECASLAVPERRDVADVGREKDDDRVISLHFARVKAVGGDSDLPPLVFIAGGPGQSAMDSFPGVRGAFSEIMRTRDVLIPDQRGTGRSRPLSCPELEEAPADPEAGFDPAEARAAAADCVRGLDADLRYYTTFDAIQDLEALRQALGEEKLVLYGISYGTRVAAEYLRRYPEHVDAVILDGVTVPGLALGPQIAADAQRALDIMFNRCAEDAVCSERFPRLHARFDALRVRLEKQPIEVDVRDPFTGGRTSARVTWSRVAGLLRLFSYAPESVSVLPLLLSQAEGGDWQGFAGSLLSLEKETETLLYAGMHNSVVCSEDAPFYPSALNEEPAYLGNLTVESIRAVCEVWPVRELPASLRAPLVSDVPVLLLSGEADPVTPPANAGAVAEHLSHSRSLVAPGQGHGVAWRGCAPQLMADFLAERDPAGLDAGCLDALAASPFFVDRNGPTP